MTIPIPAGSGVAVPVAVPLIVSATASKKRVVGVRRWMRPPRLWYLVGGLALVVAAAFVARHLAAAQPETPERPATACCLNCASPSLRDD